jgi:putative transposase
MNIYKRHRFPPEIIQHAVWLYHRFNLSHRDIEDLLVERGIQVSYEAIRLWCSKFGSEYAKRFFNRLIKSNRGKPRKIVTDKLGSYRVAHQEIIPDTIDDTSQYANNKA